MPATTAPRPAPTPTEAAANVAAWLKGFQCDEGDLLEASPWRPLDDWRQDALTLIAGLFEQQDLIAINPNMLRGGPDIIHSRNNWFDVLRKDGSPQTDAGAWIRLNPVRGASGANGTVTDADVAAYRFILIESDALPLDLQLSILARLPLTIAAIVSSGGRSLHAWVKVDCPDAASYRATAAKILRTLARFGFDQANKNPGRASRLPGAVRKLWDKDKPEPPGRDTRQRLLYLNPKPTLKPIFP